MIIVIWLAHVRQSPASQKLKFQLSFQRLDYRGQQWNSGLLMMNLKSVIITSY